MCALPLVPQLLADLARQCLVGVQDDAGLRVVAVERRGVLLEGAGQADRVLAELDRHLAVDAVKR